jgi:Flp pilus assembly protein TadG
VVADPHRRAEGGTVSVAVDIHTTPRRRHDQRGAALVEFAIASVVLLVLLFGIISYGYVLSFKQGLTQAAAEGARAGAVGGDVAAAVTRSVGAFDRTCNTGGLTCKSDTAAWPPVPYACGTRSCITVEVSYDWKNYPLLPRFPGLGLLLPDTLKSKSVTQVSS